MAATHDLNTARALLLESAIQLIKENLTVGDVFEVDQISEFAKERLAPDQVFSELQLTIWARENGFIKVE